MACQQQVSLQVIYRGVRVSDRKRITSRIQANYEIQYQYVTAGQQLKDSAKKRATIGLKKKSVRTGEKTNFFVMRTKFVANC